MKLTSIEDLQLPEAKGAEAQIQMLHRLYDDFLDHFPSDSHDRAPGIHASELAACKRQVFYSLFGVEKRESVPREWRKRFEVGKAIHDMVQSHFEGMARSSGGRLHFQREARVDDTEIAKQLCISSSCDGIFTFYNNTGPFARVGVEIKSMAPTEFENLKKPKEKHVEQAQVYAACLDLPYIWYVYWNKGNQNVTPSLHPFLVKFDPRLWEKLRRRAVECLEAADRQEPPPREEDVHCSWCPYAWTCGPKTATQRRPQTRKLRLPITR